MELVGLIIIVFLTYQYWLALLVAIGFLLYRRTEYKNKFGYKVGYLVTCTAACIMGAMLLDYGFAFIQVIKGIGFSQEETIQIWIRLRWLIIFLLYICIGYFIRKLFLQKKDVAS